MEETPAPQQQPEAAGKEAAASKEFRKRKKRLLNQIADQMDFYFSAANISKDRFMSGLLSEGPYISLQTFFKFNKIRSMTNDVAFLRKAISKSSLLELSEDGLQVRRKVPVETKDSELQCTIYVENIPSNADHDWVRQVFGEYGSIDYVSLPRYHRSGRPKGFAFVEFKTPEMAISALEAFGALECKIPLTSDPTELQSIKTYEGKTGEQVTEESQMESHHDDQDVDKEESGGGNMDTFIGKEENVKKRKLDDTSEETNEKKMKRNKDEKKTDDLMVQQEEKTMDASESEAQQGTDGGEEASAGGKKNKKKKRKRKKKEKEVVDSIYLRVMSKEDWKKLRNKYLNAQRENMKLLKMQLQDRYHQPQFRKHISERNVECDRYHDTKQSGNQDTTLRDNTVPQPQFTPNSVIKISFEEPPQDPKKLRETIREGGGSKVVYVDVSATERDVFVRFMSEEAASAYRKTGCWSRMEILAGDEEQDYWEHILSCWSQRRNKRNKQNVKQPDSCAGEPRGREKLLQKAFREAQNTKCNSHIVFDD